ncbi:hypothetical protein D6C82_05545 [Aureobasidium pullulans]|nr:hypothetical protein D6C82_05545 [Aureobasidium pullulans]
MQYLGIALASVASRVSAFPASSGTFFNGSNPQAAAAVINGTTYLNSTTTRVPTTSLVPATSIVPTTIYTTVYQGADHVVSTVYKTVTLSASSTPITGAQGNFDWPETADAPVPTVTLSPAVHWDVVVGPQNLIPANQPAPLYYNDGGPRADPSVAHSFGTLDINYKIPAVNLDHTDCATSISYDSGVLSVKFADAACFAQAQGSWSSNQQLIFITYSNICQNFANGQFCYYPEPQVSINGDNPTSTLSGGSTTSATPSSTNAACNAVDAKYGLPIGPLDVNFDRYLDDCLGYYDDLDSTPFDSYVDKISGTEDLDSKYVATEISEDETNFAYDYAYEEGNNDSLRRRDLARVHHLSRRGSTRSFNKQWSFQLLKEQKNIFDASMKIFCVGCRASGSVTIQGSGTISPLFSLTEGYVTVDANMMLALQLGVVAEVQYSYKYDELVFSFVSARTVGSVAWARKISLSAGRHVSYVKDRNSGHLRPATNDFDEVPARRRLARPPTPDAEDTSEDEVAADINAINDEDTEYDMAPVARSSLAILSQTDEEEEDNDDGTVVADDEVVERRAHVSEANVKYIAEYKQMGVGARAKHKVPTSKRYLVVWKDSSHKRSWVEGDFLKGSKVEKEFWRKRGMKV